MILYRRRKAKRRDGVREKLVYVCEERTLREESSLNSTALAHWNMDGWMACVLHRLFFLFFLARHKKFFSILLETQECLLVMISDGNMKRHVLKVSSSRNESWKKITAERRKKRMKLNDHRDDVIKWIFYA